MGATRAKRRFAPTSRPRSSSNRLCIGNDTRPVSLLADQIPHRAYSRNRSIERRETRKGMQMTAIAVVQTSDVAEAVLREQGFSEAQIERYQALRATYPFADLCGSLQEMKRLMFTKWLREHGHYSEES